MSRLRDVGGDIRFGGKAKLGQGLGDVARAVRSDAEVEDALAKRARAPI